MKTPLILDLPFAPSPEGFTGFRIKTVYQTPSGEIENFALCQDPTVTPFYGVYGVFPDGTVEHIGDRDTEEFARMLVKRLGGRRLGDSAAVFTLTRALANWVIRSLTHDGAVSLYEGLDGLYRECARLASSFEEWAADAIDFEAFEGIWPYEVEILFTTAFRKAGFCPEALSACHKPADFLAVARAIGVPLKS